MNINQVSQVNPNFSVSNYPGERRSSTLITITLAPGEIREINGHGESYHVKTTTGPVHISTDIVSQKRAYISKQGERFFDGLAFSFIELENKNSNAITVELWYGFGYFIDNTQQFLPNETAGLGTTTTLLTTGQTITFNGIPPIGTKFFQRASLFVSNLDPNLPIQVRDGTGNPIFAVMPFTSVQVDISGELQVHNPNLSSVNVLIGESWYTVR